MNVSDQVIQVIDHLCEKVGVVIDWTQENVMPYIQSILERYVRYEIATSIVWLSVFVALSTACLLVALHMTKKVKSPDSWGEYDDIAIVTWFVFAFVAIVSVFVVVCQVLDIVTCLTFPEKIILAQVRNLMRTVS